MLDGAADGEIYCVLLGAQRLVVGADDVLGVMDHDGDAGLLIAASHVMGRKRCVIRGRAVSWWARWS